MALNPLSNAFGLDIGDRTFKLVQISKRKHARTPYRVTAWSEIAVPEGVMEKGEVKDMDKAVEHISKLIHDAKGKLRGRAVVACLPEAKTFIKIIEVEKGASEEVMRNAVLQEIEQNIPLPTGEIYFDWQVIDEQKTEEAKKKKEEPESPAPQPEGDEKPAAEIPEEEAPKGRVRILLGAAPKVLVDDYMTLLEKAGLAPIALEIEAMAISRAIVPANEEYSEPLGILDIGATRSSLVIYDRGALQMSISIPISGIAITKLISESLGVSMDDAELLKRECGLAANRCEDKMWKILLPLIDDMTEKIRNALRFFKIGFPSGSKIERVYLCGGGAQFHDVDTVLSRKLTIKVRRGDSLVNVASKLPRDFPKASSLAYATAIGLGLRAADENQKYKSSFS